MELNPLHSMAVYAALACKKDWYNGKFLAAVEAHEEGVNTVFVKAKDHFFQWQEVTLPKLQDNRSDSMSEWVTEQCTFFDESTAAETEKVYIPKMPMVPSAMAPFAAKDRVTAWDLHKHIVEWKADRDTEVKELIKPVKDWLWYACLKGSAMSASAAEMSFPAVTLPSQALKN